MKKIVARLTLLAVMGGLVPLGMVAVSAGPASAGECAWRVEETAQVRENPSNNSVVRKTKHAGDRVEGPCFPHANPLGEGDHWIEVYCDCTTNGTGYIVARKLRYIGPL